MSLFDIWVMGVGGIVTGTLIGVLAVRVKSAGLRGRFRSSSVRSNAWAGEVI